MSGPGGTSDSRAAVGSRPARRFRLVAFALDDPGDAHRTGRRVAAALDLSPSLHPALSPSGRRLYVRVPPAGPRSDSEAAILRALRSTDGGPVASGPGVVDGRLFHRRSDETSAVADLDDILDWMVSTGRRSIVGATAVRSTLVLDRLRGVAATRPDLLRGHVQLLGGLDASGRTDSLATLTAFFDHGGDIVRAADAMFMHPNTVRYRLRRIQELSGLDLDDPVDRFVAEFQVRVLRPFPSDSVRQAPDPAQRP